MEETPAGLPQTWTLHEVATAFRVSEEVILGLIRSGELPGFKVGAQWRIQARHVEAFMARGPESPAVLTPTAVGGLLGVSRTTAWSLMREGQIASTRRGRKWVTTPEAVAVYQEQQARKTDHI